LDFTAGKDVGPGSPFVRVRPGSRAARCASGGANVGLLAAVGLVSSQPGS
jgi:hypothetical protein